MQTAYFQSCLGVFQGGGCRAAAFAGAIAESYRRGVYFAEVAGTSAGSIVAALLGAGATPDFLLNALSVLEFSKLVKPPDPVPELKLSLKLTALSKCLQYTSWKPGSLIMTHLGMHSSTGIEDWVEAQLELLLPGAKRPIKFSALPISTWIVAADLKRRQAQVWSKRETPDQEVAQAVRASCSIPGFFQPVSGRYVDGGVLSNLPAFVFFSDEYRRPLAKRVLAFVLDATDQPTQGRSVGTVARAITDTVVDGSEIYN